MRNAMAEQGSALTRAMFLLAAKFLSRTAFSRNMTSKLGECADYAQWQIRRLTPKPRIVQNRERIWAEMIGLLGSGRPVTVWEFGVAWGYTTDWWLRRINNGNLVWRGFDRFTGLPRAWREQPAGAYDAGGKTPDIADERVHWHVGDVENTLPPLSLERAEGTQWVVLFDLDIYEPTAFAWNHLLPHLRPGDLIYFDEALDADERRLLNEILDAGQVRFKHLMATPISLGLQIESMG